MKNARSMSAKSTQFIHLKSYVLRIQQDNSKNSTFIIIKAPITILVVNMLHE
uniref:Uncharacterized protein MANES_05G098300 n=1 Tax=Rhizophora mucronata TaxID=61149 RepID=A0A2P2P2M9_RHIMU